MIAKLSLGTRFEDKEGAEKGLINAVSIWWHFPLIVPPHLPYKICDQSNLELGGTAQSKNPFVFYFRKKRVRLSTLPKTKTKKH